MQQCCSMMKFILTNRYVLEQRTILIIDAFTSQTAICAETEAEQHRPDPVLGECSLNAPEKYWDQDYVILPHFQHRSRYIVQL